MGLIEQVRVKSWDKVISGVGSLWKVFSRRAFSRLKILF